MKTIHNIAALCALALACASTGFAQDNPQQQDVPQQQAPQQNPQQPVYYVVPQQTNTVQYVVVPQAQYQQQNQQAYMPPPQPQQPVVVPPLAPRESKVTLFMGLDINFYASSMTYKRDEDHIVSDNDIEYETEHLYSGLGVNMGLSLGVLIKDFIGIRGFFDIGEQSGESDYWNYRMRCSNDSCSNVDTDVTDFIFGISATLFPFNRTNGNGALYNAYIQGDFALNLRNYDDDFAKTFDHTSSATFFMKIEIGKLFSISETWNAGIGIAYAIDINDVTSYDDDHDSFIDETEGRQSFWAGVRFVRKKNKS